MARPLRVAPLALAVVAAGASVCCSAGREAHGEDVESAVTSASSGVSTSVATTATTTTIRSAGATATPPAASTTSTTTSTPTTSTTSLASPIVVQPAPVRTSCTTVAHVGDSTSVGLFQPEFLPVPGDALPAQYERVGLWALYTEVSPGRSTIEAIGGDENAFDTVVRLREMGYRGCWVVTIGTNDAANVAIGGIPDLRTRLDRMMFLFGSDPVLWVDAVTHLDDGPYADTNMQTWNEVLDEAAVRYPTLRLLHWSDVALDEWFVPDGIHYTSGGWAWRSHAIADALAAAFPARVG